MATAKDIQVNLDEWNSVKIKLQKTDDAFNDALNAYLAILRTLVYQGIEKGNIHNNLRSLYYSAEELRSSSDEICTKIKDRINALKEIQELDSWDSKRSGRSNFDFTVKTTNAIKHKLQKLEQTCGDKLTLESNKISIADNGLIESAVQLTELRIIRDGREDLEALFRKASGKFSTLCNEVEELDISVSRKLDSLRRDLNAMEKELAALTDYMQMDLSKAGALQNMPTPDTLERINQCAMKNSSGTCTYDYEEIRAILQKSADDVTYADLLVLQAVLETMINVEDGNIEPDTENLSKFISAAYVKQGETDVERLEHQYYDGETTDLYYYFHNQAELSPAFRMLAEATASSQKYTDEKGCYQITEAGAICDLLKTVTDHYSILEWQDCWKIDIHLYEYEDDQERQKDFYLERFNKACQARIDISYESEEGTDLHYFKISGTSFQGGDVSLEKQQELRERSFCITPEKFYQSGDPQKNYTIKRYLSCANNTEQIGELTEHIVADYEIRKFYDEDINVAKEGLQIIGKTATSEVIDLSLDALKDQGLKYIPVVGIFLDVGQDIHELREDIKKAEENNAAVDRALAHMQENYNTETMGYSDLGLYYNTMTAVIGTNDVAILREDYVFEGKKFSETYTTYVITHSVDSGIADTKSGMTDTELAIYKTVLDMRIEGKTLPTAETISPILESDQSLDKIDTETLEKLIAGFNEYIDDHTEITGIKLSDELNGTLIDEAGLKSVQVIQDSPLVSSVNEASKFISAVTDVIN